MIVDFATILVAEKKSRMAIDGKLRKADENVPAAWGHVTCMELPCFGEE